MSNIVTTETVVPFPRGKTLGEFRRDTSHLPDEAVMSVHVTRGDRPWESSTAAVHLTETRDTTTEKEI